MRFKVPSYVFVAGLTVVAMLPSVPAPLSALSLGTRLGTYLYVGVLLVLAIGYVLAKVRENAARDSEATKRHDEIKILLRIVADLAAPGSQILAQNEVTHAMLTSLQPTLTNLQQLYRRRDIALHGAVRSGGRVMGATLTPSISGTVSSTLPAPAASAVGTVTPGPGRLQIEGMAPTSSVKALDQEIRQKEETVLRHFRLHAEPGVFRLTGFPLRDSEGKELPHPDWAPESPSGESSS